MTDTREGATCARCRAKRHSQCAATMPCACRDNAHVAARTRTYAGTLRADALTIGDDDARAIMGARGVWQGTRAYAWCAREGAYHIGRTSATLPIPRKRSTRLQWQGTTDTRTRTAPVRTTGHARTRAQWRAAQSFKDHWMREHA
jgi:hypothetical protein